MTKKKVNLAKNTAKDSEIAALKEQIKLLQEQITNLIGNNVSNLKEIKQADSNGKIIATDETIWDIIENAIKEKGNKADLNFIDTSNVTNMAELFSPYDDFNGDVSQWNVSNVTNMSCMFIGCRDFNCDLSKWNTSKVEAMDDMFCGCDQFNEDISQWDTSNVTDMSSMFMGCHNFNQDLSKWDTSKVTNMAYMFTDCYVFYSDLSSWNVSKVLNMNMMFKNCRLFVSDLLSWNTFICEKMHDMFEGSRMEKTRKIPFWWYDWRREWLINSPFVLEYYKNPDKYATPESSYGRIRIK